MTDDPRYIPHDPHGEEWTCMRCGAVIADSDTTELHTLFHDALDTLRPVVDNLVTAVITHADLLDPDEEIP